MPAMYALNRTQQDPGDTSVTRKTEYEQPADAKPAVCMATCTLQTADDAVATQPTAHDRRMMKG